MLTEDCGDFSASNPWSLEATDAWGEALALATGDWGRLDRGESPRLHRFFLALVLGDSRPRRRGDSLGRRRGESLLLLLDPGDLTRKRK